MALEIDPNCLPAWNQFGVMEIQQETWEDENQFVFGLLRKILVLNACCIFSWQVFKGIFRIVDLETHDGKISIQIGNGCKVYQHFSTLHGICSSSGTHKHFNQQLSCASASKLIMEGGLTSLISTTDITFASILSSLLRNKGVSGSFQPSELSIRRAVYAAVVYCFHTSRMIE